MRLTLPTRAREAQPAREEGEAADRRDRAEPAVARQTQKIEAAGEDDCAGEEEPARGHGPRARPARGGPPPGDGREGGVQLIAHAYLEGRQHVGVEPPFQPVRAERPRRHSDKRRDCSDQEKYSVHTQLLAGSAGILPALSAERRE